jgi:hypothetical protein
LLLLEGKFQEGSEIVVRDENGKLVFE